MKKSLIPLVLLGMTLMSIQGPLFAQDVGDVLARADRIRISDAAGSKALLDSLLDSQLTSAQAHEKRYLLAVNTAFSGDIQSALSDLTMMLPVVLNARLRIRIMSTILSLQAGSKDWLAGLRTANTLQKDITRYPESETTVQAGMGLVFFYFHLKLYDKAEQMALRSINEFATPEQRCMLLSTVFSIHVTTQSEVITDNDYKRATELCDTLPVSAFTRHADYYYAEHLLASERYKAVLPFIDKAILTIAPLQYVHQTIALETIKAQALWFLGEWEAADALSDKILSTPNAKQYLEAYLKVSRLKRDIAHDTGNLKAALKWGEIVSELEAKDQSNNVIQQLAISRVQGELRKQKQAIASLNTHNQNLKTKVALAQINSNNGVLGTLLVIVLSVIVSVSVYLQLKHNRELRHTSQHDPLTGLYNRRAFVYHVTKRLVQGKQKDQHYTLMLFDLDLFSQINEAFGQATGDWALCAVAESLGHLCEDMEPIVARIGGEEFVVLIRGEIDDGDVVASVCRQRIQGISTAETGHSFTLSASFGLANTKHVGYALENLLKGADLALYQSKSGGRNQVHCYQYLQSA